MSNFDRYISINHLGLDMGEPYYEIICLKRSRFADSEVSEYTSEWWRSCKIVYWRPNAQGYTEIPSEAGLYTLDDIRDIAGIGLDWMIMRTQFCDFKKEAVQ